MPLFDTIIGRIIILGVFAISAAVYIFHWLINIFMDWVIFGEQKLRLHLLRFNGTSTSVMGELPSTSSVPFLDTILGCISHGLPSSSDVSAAVAGLAAGY